MWHDWFSIQADRKTLAWSALAAGMSLATAMAVSLLVVAAALGCAGAAKTWRARSS